MMLYLYSIYVEKYRDLEFSTLNRYLNLNNHWEVIINKKDWRKRF
ncbi:hypothetical protein CNEO3_240008 [Clostridium neonatale]|uniref:Uncharacterized protein n=1 Tax=Clostridium neonatale TaxID=137838 RepID=A0AAD2DFZ9_9CLOT|nr:hypothetical protein CNEO_90227 [Clostridium neonatale]CAG9714827.1 hypothetical protein CNEO_260030 [Clostridium neonatale]CAI3198398.1 hypothetical protein CNEO2_180036 [Clostridium neonatale]CAI3198816.1 hypothetical protein CNEO2_160032 [Clostridium neonatale]CAI3201343.1 hypothetical protein CNEO2_310036 [Clostridium neonatale]